MLCAELRIESSRAEDIISALTPEAGRELPRTQIELRAEGDCAIVSVRASDTSALRAALNSYLECIKIIEDIDKITG